LANPDLSFLLRSRELAQTPPDGAGSRNPTRSHLPLRAALIFSSPRPGRDSVFCPRHDQTKAARWSDSPQSPSGSLVLSNSLLRVPCFTKFISQVCHFLEMRYSGDLAGLLSPVPRPWQDSLVEMGLPH